MKPRGVDNPVVTSHPLRAGARHLIGMVERREVGDLPALFAAVERLQVEGDHYLREAATVGLLEGLQNLNLHPNGTAPDEFRPYLGEQSARWWDKLNQFWQQGEMLTDDERRAEPGAAATGRGG
jgi:hypothetical protein